MNQGASPVPLEYVPRWATGVVIGVFVLVWISGVTVIASHDLPSQPEYHAITHTYSANDHGTEIPLSKVQYEAAVRAQDRLFLSGARAFIVIGVGAAADEAIDAGVGVSASTQAWGLRSDVGVGQ